MLLIVISVLNNRVSFQPLILLSLYHFHLSCIPLISSNITFCCSGKYECGGVGCNGVLMLSCILAPSAPELPFHPGLLPWPHILSSFHFTPLPLHLPLFYFVALFSCLPKAMSSSIRLSMTNSLLHFFWFLL